MIRSEQHPFRSQTSHIHAKLAAQVEQLLHPVQGESGKLCPIHTVTETATESAKRDLRDYKDTPTYRS